MFDARFHAAWQVFSDRAPSRAIGVAAPTGWRAVGMAYFGDPLILTCHDGSISKHIELLDRRKPGRCGW